MLALSANRDHRTDEPETQREIMENILPLGSVTRSALNTEVLHSYFDLDDKYKGFNV